MTNVGSNTGFSISFRYKNIERRRRKINFIPSIGWTFRYASYDFIIKNVIMNYEGQIIVELKMPKKYELDDGEINTLVTKYSWRYLPDAGE